MGSTRKKQQQQQQQQHNSQQQQHNSQQQNSQKQNSQQHPQQGTSSPPPPPPPPLPNPDSRIVKALNSTIAAAANYSPATININELSAARDNLRAAMKNINVLAFLAICSVSS